MTRKNYVAFAEMFKRMKPDTSGLQCSRPEDIQWRMTVDGAAELFQRDNPRFDRMRFLDACGYTS